MVDDDFIIRGTAINETTTHNNHKYIAEELEKAAPGLMGKPLLVDHDNSIESIKGRITDSMFDINDKSIKFEAKVMDKKIREMIKDGRINSVSIGAFAEDLVKDEESGSFIAKGIKFAELSLVAVPGDENANFGMAFANNYDLKEKLETEIKTESKSISERRYDDMEQDSLKLMESEKNKLVKVNTKLMEELESFKKEKRQSLEEKYKKLCVEKKLKEKDISKVSDETVSMLIEQLSEIVTEKEVKKKVELKAEISEKEVPKGMENLVFENGGEVIGNAFWVMPDSKGRTSIKWQ